MRRKRKVTPYLATIYGYQIISPLPCARTIQTIPVPRAAHQPGKRGAGLRPRGESGALKIESDEEASRMESYLDGCYVIKTDLKESEADKHLVHDRYKDLTELEKMFRGCRW